MTKQRRFAAALLAVLVLVAMATSLFVMSHAACHDCIGEGCLLCAVITLCRNTLKTLCVVLIAAAAVFACFRFTASVIASLLDSLYDKTPITLKVKLLN